MKTQRRRRKEAKTDYKARFSMLKSEKPRIVVRRSNRYILAQVVISETAQDKAVARVSSKELLHKGWPSEKAGSLKSIHAAYLTGFMFAKKLKGKVNEAIFDIGLNRNIPGSRIHAFLRGAVEGGLNIPHNPESFPSEERFKQNQNLFKLMERIKEKL